MKRVDLALAAFLLGAALGSAQTFAFPGPNSVYAHGSGSQPTPTGKSCYAQVSSSPITCTWSTAIASGETTACWVTNLGATSAYSLSDSGSNAYSPNGGIQSGYGFWSAFFYSHASAPAATTTASLTGSVNVFTIYCTTYTGGIGAPDGAVGYTGNGSGASNTVDITTSVTHSLEICFGAYANSGNYAVDASFTRLTGSAPSNIAGDYEPLPGYGTYATTWTPPSTSSSDLECAGYK